jgi:putative sterol carrier protein
MSEPVALDELREALVDYVERANASDEAARVLSDWSCRIHVEAVDVPGGQFTLAVEKGRSADLVDGFAGAADLVVRGPGTNLAEVFWGDVNPAAGYLQGEITTQGSLHDVFRLDAMAMIVFNEQS